MWICPGIDIRPPAAQVGVAAKSITIETLLGNKGKCREYFGAIRVAFHRLNVPSTLNVAFLSTNHIENVMGNARGTIGRICRWQDDTNQVSRWMGVALLRAQSGFRRVRGHGQLSELVAALGRSQSI